MLITIENFGAIKYFQFDTEKDLYLIFGKNSVGKSYAISLVYLILKKILDFQDTWRNNRDTLYFLHERDMAYVKELEKNIEKSNDKEIDISQYIEKNLILYFDFFTKQLNVSLINTFNDINNLQNKFSKDNLKITLEWQDSSFHIDMLVVLGLNKNIKRNISLNVIEHRINEKFIVKKVKRWQELKRDNLKKQIIFHYTENRKESFEINYISILVSLVSNFFNELQVINYVYYLPASRSGLYQTLSAFGRIIAELTKNRGFISGGIDLPAISEPIADYFLHLSNINSSQKTDKNFTNYANEIEKEILQGKVEFDNKSKKLFFTPNETKLKLDLLTTSSMVSEISPIVSYIKYIFPTQRTSKWVSSKEQKPLVFIEEPEAHLHPETQVKLMAVFARLAKDNKIKLIMTSHSNYIFNKASNLVMDNKIDKEKFSAVLFESTPEGSVAKILETDEYGIEDENFINTAESIYEEKIDLINKLNG